MSRSARVGVMLYGSAVMTSQMWRTSAAEVAVDKVPVWMSRVRLKGLEAET